MKRIALFPLRAALLFLALLGGCLPDKGDKGTRVAGGDDIPNEVEPLGKRAAEARDDSTDWNGFREMPRSAPGMYDTAAIPDTVPDTAGAGHAQPKSGAGTGARPAPIGNPAGPLAKRSAGISGSAQEAAPAEALPLLPLDSLPLGQPADTMVTRVIDTGEGTVEAVRVQVKDSVRTVDSTVFAPPDPARPGSAGTVIRVSGRVAFADTGVWETYLFRDADGDGSLAPRPGSSNLADVETAVKTGDGLVTRFARRVAAGPDLDFNRRDDNRLLAGLTVVTDGADTVRTVRLLDADGDSAVIDFAKDTNLVDVIETLRGPAGTGTAAVTVATRMVAFSRDSARNYAVRYRRAEAGEDGGSLLLEGRGPRADSSFRAGDEASWIVTRVFPPGGETAFRERIFSVSLGARPGDFAADLLSNLETRERYRGPDYDSFFFALKPDDPVADGGWPAGGEVEASLDYRDGTGTAFSGTADAQGMRGNVRDVSGRTLSISFDRQGRPSSPR